MTTTYPGNPARTPAMDADRAAFITGLRDLADWLENHPRAPVSRFGQQVGYTPGSVAEVRKVAAGLGMQPEDCPAIVRATLRFGPIRYVVWASRSEGRS